MTVTRLGPDLPKLTSGLSGTSQVPPSGGSGQVVTANGSNGAYWGENIARITANGSNQLLGPFVSLLSGTGVSFAVSSNSLTISGSSGGLPWYDMKVDGGLVGDGVTDDTAAFQAAITAGTSSGTQSRTFYFPPGTYLIGGALQDTGAFNGQILLPNVSTASAQITIRFLGAARPPFAVHGALPAPGGYSIIKSTLTGATGTAAVVSGGNGAYPGTQNNVSVIVEDLVCLTPANPSMTFWNLAATQGGAIRNVYISTTAWNAIPASAPTNTNAYGVKLPQVRNSNYTYVDGLVVYFYGNGIMQGELCIVRGLIISGCLVGVEFVGPAEHASLIVDMQVTGTPRPLKATGLHYCDILSYDFETTTGPGWSDIVYDLDDASNYLHGSARYWGYPNPPTHAFTKNGGTNFTATVIGDLAGGPPTGAAGGDLSGTYPNPSVVDDSHSHTSATAPGSGGGSHILLADGHATPFTFNDMLQMDDGSDFMWSD